VPAGAYRECNHTRCPKYATHNGFCEDHQRTMRDRTAGPTGANLRPSNLRFRWMRAAYLHLHPMCAVCHLEPATELDHKTPHRGASRLFWDQNNWQGLCRVCHGRKTAREVLEGNR